MAIRIPVFILFISMLCTKTIAQLPYRMDSSFGTYGMTMPETMLDSGLSSETRLHQIFDAVLQPDGKLLMAGTANSSYAIEVVRLNIDGTPDTSFNHRGFAIYQPNPGFSWKFHSIRVAPSGNIILGCTCSNPSNIRYSVLCVKPNGMLNTAFGTAGKTDVTIAHAGKQIYLNSMDLQPDGKIILAGGGTDGFVTEKYVLARITTAGLIDSTYGVNGIVQCPYALTVASSVTANAIRIQPDGKAVFSGVYPGTAPYTDTVIMVRYKLNGTFDSSYGVNGMTKVSSSIIPGQVRLDTAGYSYVIGRLYVYGGPDTFFIMKFSPTGAIVSSFGTAGTVTVNATINNKYTYLSTLVNVGHFDLLPNGCFVVAGPSDSTPLSAYRVCKLLPDGQNDTTFAPNGIITIPRGKKDYCTGVLAQPDGRIVLTGFNRVGSVVDTAHALAMRLWDGTIITPPPPPLAVIGTQSGTQFSWSVYPNPLAGTQLNIAYNNAGTTSSLQYRLLNTQGRQVATGTTEIIKGTGTATIGIDKKIPAGQYLLQLRGSEFSEVQRVVIER